MADQNLKGFFEQKNPKDIEYFVELNLDISDQISEYLNEKSWTQKDLANALGKTESEISKWMSGTHNLTLRSIAKISAVFDKNIITTPANISASKVRIFPLYKAHPNECRFSNEFDSIEDKYKIKYV